MSMYIHLVNSLQYLRSEEVPKSLCPGVLPACDHCRAGGPLPAAGEAARGGVLVDAGSGPGELSLAGTAQDTRS